MSNVNPVVEMWAIPGRESGPKYVMIRNIYEAHHGNLYLYDPNGPEDQLPYEVSQEGKGDDLSLTWEEARNIRDRLNEILGE